MRSVPLNERIALVIAQKIFDLVFDSKANSLLYIAWVHSDLEKRVRSRKCTTQNFYLSTDSNNPLLTKKEYTIHISLGYRNSSIPNSEKSWEGLAGLLINGNLVMEGEWELREDNNDYYPLAIKNIQALGTWLTEHFQEAIWQKLGIKPVDSFQE